MKRIVALIVLVLLILGCNRPPAGTDRKMIILGIDGMDPVLLRGLIAEGKMPNFKKLIDSGGGFTELQTTPPPQSPVAWSTLITGLNPGGHGIYDFLHRDPKEIKPYFSTSKSLPGESLELGGWQFPWKSGEIKNLREGDAFWELLNKARVPATVSRIPANYPPVCECQHNVTKLISGMGTPDLLGTQGTFLFYSSDPGVKERKVGGGRITKITEENGKISFTIPGPDDPYKKGRKLVVDGTIWLDRSSGAARIDLGKEGDEEKIVLKEGEFSDWSTLDYSLLGGVQSIKGMVRLYLKQLSPFVELYISPINIDPREPAVGISYPPEYAAEAAEGAGLFYTQNMPPDTKALQHEVFDHSEFLKQVEFVYQDESRLLRDELKRFKDGLLFLYFGVVDQVAHMFWSARDPLHPSYTDQLGEKYGDVIEDFYIRMDKELEYLMENAPSDALIMIVSDHGFSSFRRGVNVNTVLYNNGLLTLKDPSKQGIMPLLKNVDWSKTKAYGLGINSLYLNMKGREREGIVTEDEKAGVTQELKEVFLNFRDPINGENPVKTMLSKEELYYGDHLEIAPDMIIGYDHNYRSSWKSILGSVPRDEVVDNTHAWTGDHSIHYELVPGVVLANRTIHHTDPSLSDITPTILDFFGIDKGNGMDGRSIFSEEGK